MNPDGLSTKIKANQEKISTHSGPYFLALESVRYQESDVYVSKPAQCAYVDGRYLATLCYASL